MFQHEIDDIWDEAYEQGRADALTSNGINIYVDKIREETIDECIDIVTDHNALITPLGYERIVNDMAKLKEQTE